MSKEVTETITTMNDDDKDEEASASEPSAESASAEESETTNIDTNVLASTDGGCDNGEGSGVEKPEVEMASTSSMKILSTSSKVIGTSVLSGIGAGKDNVIYVVNKVEPGGSGGGEMNIISKPLTVLGSSVSGGAAAAILKKGSVMGNTILKVQKVGSPQGSPILAKKSLMIASGGAGGVKQLITCAPGSTVVQQAGATPVVLTQKVATSGGILASPVLSTGRVGTFTSGAKILSATSVSSSSQQHATSSQQRVQDVRVDNWGNYCIQRLQGMYEKGDYCDLTLKFHSGEEIKVHRVVVNLCTEYFSNLEKTHGLKEGTLTLTKDIEFQIMQNIIRFFYTGKLEVRVDQFNDIYKAVKLMNITILIKLLEAHSRKPAQQVKREGLAGRSAVVLKQAVGESGQLQIKVAGTSQSQSPVIAVPGTKNLQVAASGVKLPPGVKSKTVLARLQNPGAKAGQSMKTTPKKLPIWKERKFAPVVQEPPKIEQWKIKKEEPARPTRFEWGDPDEPDPFFISTPTLTNHALMEKQKEKYSTRKAEDIFDSVKNQQQTQTTNKGVKRMTSEAASTSSGPPAKIPKVVESPTITITPDLPKDDKSEGEGTASSDETSEVISGDVNSEADLDKVPIIVESQPTGKKPIPILKPTLKSPLKLKDGSPQKTVRFAPEVEKDSAEKEKATTSSVSTSPAVTVSVAIPSSSAASSSTPPVASTSQSLAKPSKATPIVIPSSDGGDALANHSKIISEVLRKFPDLVKDSKNIKLKIMQKPADGSSPSSSSGKDAKSKVSYIVLKSTSSPDSTSSATVLKKSPAQSSVSKFWERDKTPKKPSPAENTTGPWLCERCGEGENTALQFDTYYNFRRHLVDVHAERIDARICEYCGQKASKRNLLLYHLYTKHGVQPPKNCTFPHCDQCDYVALSESLLTKHKQNHDANKEYCCSICNASFKTNATLQAHMAADLHRNKDTKVYECPYCRKPFVRNINLKAHIRSLHRDVARVEEMEDPRLPSDDALLTRKLISGFNKKRGFPSILTTTRTASSTAGLVEFISADAFAGGQSISYVTADGQPIEILDPSTLTSLPLTLVTSGEDGMAAIATSVTSGLEAQPVTTSAGTTQYITATSVAQDGNQPVYVMDGAQGAVEVDMSNMGMTMAPDGTMIYEGEDPNCIIQDMHGNQFRKITGIDESGKPVVFLQMIGGDPAQVSMGQAILDESSLAVDGNTNSQMFMSSAGIPIPVSTEGQQVIFASTAAGGTILEMVPTDDGSGSHHQVVMNEAVLTSQDGDQHNETQHQHLQLVQHDQTSLDQLQDVIQQQDQLGQPVQELHIMLDQQETANKEVAIQDGGDEQQPHERVEIVEIEQQETYTELQLSGEYEEDGTSIEAVGVDETEETSQEETIQDLSEVETQEMEIDESSQQLQIDEGTVEVVNSSEVTTCENQEVEEMQEDEEDQEDTQVITEDENLQESIELVEGQTLTLIEDEDGLQRLQVEEGNVEEIST